MERLPKIAALFAAGVEVTAHATEDPRASPGANVAGDFLTHFDHVDVMLGLEVGKGRARIETTGQDAPIKSTQTIPQIGRPGVCIPSLTLNQ